MATKLELGVRCAFRKKPKFLHKQRYTEIEYDGFGPKVLGSLVIRQSGWHSLTVVSLLSFHLKDIDSNNIGALCELGFMALLTIAGYFLFLQQA